MRLRSRIRRRGPAARRRPRGRTGLLAYLLLVPAAALAAEAGDGDEDAPPSDADSFELERSPQPRRQLPAEEAEPREELDDFSKPIWEWRYGSGDWGGARRRLARRGIVPELIYAVEVFSNVDGGARTGTEALGHLDLTLTLDSERLKAWKGGTLFLHFESLMGKGNGINRKLGDPLSPVSSLNASTFTQLSAYFYVHRLLDDALRLKVGKQDAAADFLSSPVADQFINGGIAPPENIPMPTYPDPGLGFALFARREPGLSLGAGVFGGDPDGESYDDAGLFGGDVFAILELGFEPSFGGLAGAYRAGAWLLTKNTREITEGPDPRVFDENYGFYLLFDQRLFREDVRARAEQGLEAYFELSWAPKDRNQVELWVGGGLVYTGAIPGRDRDGIGLTAHSSEVSPRLAGRSAEIVIEAFYRLELTRWLHFQPDLQYYIDPGGRGRNALALGLRTLVAF